MPGCLKRMASGIMVTSNIIIDRTSYGIIYNSGSFFSGLGDKAIRNTFDVSFTVITAQNSIH